MMPWVFDDGGREAAGFKGRTGDCGVRAIAIATGRDYRGVYEQAHAALVAAPVKVRGRSTSPRDGLPTKIMREMLAGFGWVWQPTMHIGGGCQVHLLAEELPAGRLIVRLSRHYAAVVDGVVRDTYDPNVRIAGFWPAGDGPRCVYGFWREAL